MKNQILSQKNNCNLNIHHILIFFIIVLLIGCGGSSTKNDGLSDPKSYTATRTKLFNSWKNGHYNLAHRYSQYWVGHAKKNNPKDYYINLLEKGKTALACNKYDEAITTLRQAEKRFLNIEGQLALGEEIGALFSDDLNVEYEAENYEKLLIPSYLLLAYWQKGDYQGAKVEAKRVLQKISQYIESSKANSYLENPFNRLLTALVFEKEGESDDVRIELNKIAKINNYFAHVAKMEREEMEKNDDDESSICVFVDVGTSPMKHPRKFGPLIVSLANGTTISLAFVYSIIKKTFSRTSKCRVYVDGKFKGDTYLIYNVENIVMAQFKKNEPKKISKIKKRALVKATTAGVASYAAAKAFGRWAGVLTGIAGAVWMYSERADLRSWLTLPKTIQYRRVNYIDPGKHVVQLEAVDARGYVVWKTKPKVVHIEDDSIVEVVHFTVTI